MRSSVGRTLAAVLFGRLVAGPRVEDAVRVAAELVSDGRRVALEHVPGPGDDAAAELAVLIGEIHAAGLAADCELTLPAEHLGLAPTAAAAGLAMGYASRLAFGCNVGAYFSGIATGSLHGWAWFGAAFLGSVLGVRARPALGFG